MKTTLSEDRVKRLAGPDKPGKKRDVWDETHRGLHVRITRSKSGAVSKRWRFQYTVGDPDNRRRRFWTLGSWPGISVKDAQAWADRARQYVDAGLDPKAEHEKIVQQRERERLEAERRSLVSLAAAHVRYQRRRGLESTTILEEVRQLRREVFEVVNKETPAAEVHPEDVDAVIGRIVDRGSKRMAARVRSTIFSIYKWGRADRVWRHILDTNPVEATESPLTKEEKRPRTRVLEDDEVKSLWLAAEPAEDGKADLPSKILHPVIGAAFRLRLLTGQRWTEIVKARWEDIRQEVAGDSTVWTWTIPRANTKSRERTHVIPLSPQALAVLEAVRPITEKSGWIFPALRGDGHLGTVNRSFRAWKERAGVDDFIGKDIRRTVTTGLSRLGVGLEVRDAITNHAPKGTTKRVYDRYDLMPEKLAALEKWGRYVDRLVTGVGADVIPIRARGGAA